MATGVSNCRENSPIGEVSLLQKLKGHNSDVTSCDFAPNFTVITGSSDKTVRVWEWNPSDGRGYRECEQSPLIGHKYGVTCVRVSPQGAMLATASVDGTAILWALKPIMRLKTFVQTNGDSIRMCRFSPNSSLLVTGGQNGAICVWDMVHKSLIRTVLKHEGTVESLAFTSDSQLLISGCSNGILLIWNVRNLTDTTIETCPSPTTYLDNAHDLGILSCDACKIIKYDDNNPLVKTYSFVTSGNENIVKIWQVVSHSVPKHDNKYQLELKHELEGHESTVTTVRYSSTGNLLASAGLDKTIRLWKNCQEKWECMKVLESHSRYINCVAFSKDSLLLASGSNDKSTIIWSLSENITLKTEFVKPSEILSALNNIQYDPDNVRESDVIRHARNQQNDNEVKLIEVLDDISEGSINSCKFFGNNKLVTGSGDKLIKLFHLSDDTHTAEELSTSPFEGHTYPVNHVDFYKDGSKIVSCSLDGSAIIWETQTGRQLCNIPVSETSIRVCKYSPDGQFLVTAGDDEVVIIWDVATMNKIKCLEGHTESITSVSFTIDSSLLASVCNNGSIRLWKMPEGNLDHIENDAHDLGTQCCDFSPDCGPIPRSIDTSLLATCGNDGYVKLWLVIKSIKGTKVKLWKTLEGHGGNVTSVKFSPHTGEILASTAFDRQCRLWSVYTGECLHVLEHDSITTCCDFSIDTLVLAVGCLDKTVSLWELPQTLVFHTKVANEIKSHKKSVAEWRIEDIAKWVTEIGFSEISHKIMTSSLDGHKLLTLPIDKICKPLEISEVCEVRFREELDWLRHDELNPIELDNVYDQIPNEFFCPITHELMQWPVTCSDGFTYERQAITEWFLSGRYTSPMTNEDLPNTDFVLNRKLRYNIHKFLYGSRSNDL